MVLPTPEQEAQDDRRNEDFMQRLNAALIKNNMLDEVKELTPLGLKKTFGGKKQRYVRSDGTYSHIPLLEENKNDGGISNSLGNGMRIGMEMAGGPVVGFGLGYGLDQWLGTSPWCLITLIIMGLAAGFLNVFRLIRQEEDPWIKGHHEAQETLTKAKKKAKSPRNNT